MRSLFFSVAVALSSTAPMAMAAPVDLSGWKVNTVGAPSNANWVLEVGNNGVKQTVNGSPTVFFNQGNSQGKALAGTIEVQTTSDDDFIGFVLGFNDGDFSNPSADYLIIDWKQSTQAFGSWGTALVGLSISRVSGVLADDSGPWAHDPARNVTELARATNLGSTGWANNTEYTFDLVFNSTLVEVFVNGVKELSVGGTFSDGSFGFYNYSQANVRYAGIEETVAPPPPPPNVIPLPAALPLLGAGMGVFAFMGWRRRRA